MSEDTLPQRCLSCCIVPALARPGMRLFHPVTLADGRVLMRAGKVLDELSLLSLQQRGIEYVFVAVADRRSHFEAEADRLMAREQVEFIFRGASTRPRESLKEAVVAYRLREVMSCPMPA